MALLFVSFLAGILSVLAPCVIALMPVLLGRSADGKRARNPVFIIAGLSGSIILFSILLKASTALINIPATTWQIISGLIILFFGITYLCPELWEKISMALRLQEKANKTSGKALQKQGRLGDVILGASLGPVFSACSPTYALIVASVLPATPVRGFLYLLAFTAGLAGMLVLISVMGSKLVQKLGWGINPNGLFKKVLGVSFIVIGLLIATGTDKEVLSFLVERGLFDWQVQLESRLQQ